jgi:hypothetical protein
MKKTLLTATGILLFAAIACAFFINRSEDKKYSCDPKIDAWVKANKKHLANLSRKEVGQLSRDSAIAVLFCMSGDHQYGLWREKIRLVYGTLSKPEQEHFSILLHKFSSKPYENEKDRLRFNKFLSTWIEEGKTKFRWTQLKIYLMIGTLGTEEELRFGMATRSSLTTRSDTMQGESVYCNCWVDCTGVDGTQNCNHNNITCTTNCYCCGPLGTSACNGNCVPA